MARARYDPSLDRQELNRLEAEFSRILRAFSSPWRVVRGNVETLRRRCGKPRCRCSRGKLHETLVFVDRSSGARRIRKVNLGLYQKLEKPAHRYQKLRKLRARLTKLHTEVLECCDRLLGHRVDEGNEFLSKLVRK